MAIPRPRLIRSEDKQAFNGRSYLGVLAVCLSALVFFSVQNGWLWSLDKTLYDQLLRSSSQEPPKDITIIAIDERSIENIGRWPWRRSEHAKLIDLLSEANVKAIAYDVVFAERSSKFPQDDEQLAAALRRSPPIIFPSYFDNTQAGGQILEVLPHAFFHHNINIGHVNTALDDDGIVRRFYGYVSLFGESFTPHFGVAAAAAVGSIPAELEVPESVPEHSDAAPNYNPMFSYIRTTPFLIPFVGSAGSFQKVSFYDVVNGTVALEQLRDHVVFVGTTAITLGDLLPTPQTMMGEQMPGVEINANIFHAVRSGRLIDGGYNTDVAVLSAVVVFITVLLIPIVAGRLTLFAITLLSFAWVGVEWIALSLFQCWLPLATLIVGQWLAYPLWMVLRLDQTFRYLQRQLVSLRRALGNQSLAKRSDVSDEAVLKNLHILMNMLGIHDFALYRDNELLQRSEHPAADMEFLWGKPMGAHLLSQHFCFRHGFDGGIYTLQIPCDVSQWKTTRTDFIESFFKRGMQQPRKPNPGVYDLVFKYLADVKESQDELNNARFLFEYCVNEMNDGIVIADEFGRILFYNRLALTYLNLDPNHDYALLTVLNDLHISGDPQTWNTILLDLVQRRQARQCEVSSPNNTAILLSLTYLDLRADRSNLIVINLNDITHIREAQRLRNETINFLSHDMRSPMVSLIALVNQQRGTDVNQEFLDQIEHYANRNLYFAEQFLQLARVEGTDSLQFYDIDFDAVVQNAVDDVYVQAQEASVSLKLAISPLDCWVRGNGELLERAVVNLITNAIKYGADGGVIEVELDVVDSKAIFKVRDFGLGIPKERQKLLFASFQRIQDKRQQKKRGAGLGLRFVDVTIQRHGGRVFFTSEPGRTEFGFELPLLDMEL